MRIEEALSFDDVILVPRHSEIESRNDVDLSTQLTRNIRLKIPIVSASMDTVTEAKMATALGLLGGIGIIHRFMTIEEQVSQVQDCKSAFRRGIGYGANNCVIGAAIGIKDWDRRAPELVDAGVDVLSLDIANGDSSLALKTIRAIKSQCSIDLIAGNIATREAAYRLKNAGVDAVKVGLGSGSTCVTRVVTGIGMPQLEAIWACQDISTVENIPIIADGGVRNSGDIVKALAAGASSVMLGSLLAGTDESPSELVKYPYYAKGMSYKVIRGMASKSAIEKQRKLNGENGDIFYIEGVEGRVPYVGSLKDQIDKLTAGIRSGMSYLNARTVPEIHQHAEFRRITTNGLTEGKPHSILL